MYSCVVNTAVVEVCFICFCWLVPESNIIAIFGGYGYSSSLATPHRLNDLLLFNAESQTIDRYIEPVSNRTSPSDHLPISPPPRVHASLCSLQNGLFLFGGRKSPQFAMNDCWFFEFASNQWLSLPQPSPCPSPRWNCSITRVNDHIAFVYGGRDSEQVFGDCWTVLLKKGSEGQMECRWFLLYDSDNTLYNMNESPGKRFGALTVPLLQQGCCDEVLIWGGVHTLLGECLDSRILFKHRL